MSRTLIIGDVHLGKGISIGKPGIGTAYNSRIADQKKLLDWILDVACEKHVDRFILTGDVFEDVKPDYALVQIFIDWLKIVECENIDVHIITGNHDIKRSGSLYTSILDIVSSCDFHHVFVYKHITTIQTPGAGFTFLPYRDRRGLNCKTNSEALSMIEERLEYEALSISSLDDKVLVGHLTLEGAIYIDEVDDLMNELICPLQIFSGYNYVWMGHVHRPQVRSRRPYIAHIGSLDLSDFGESDQQKILILYDPSLEKKFETIKVPSRPLRRLKVNVPEVHNPTEFVLEQIKQHNENYSYKDALVRIDVTINGSESSSLDRKKIENFIYECGAFFLCQFSESRNISVVPLDKKDLVDSSVDEKSAIKLYSNMLSFTDETEHNEFVGLCLDVIKEYQAGLK